MMSERFIVIKNSPGYLPETEPAEFDSYTDAVEYMNDEVRQYVEDLEYFNIGVRKEEGIASQDNYAAVKVYRSDKINDLGVVFQVVADHGE